MKNLTYSLIILVAALLMGCGNDKSAEVTDFKEQSSNDAPAAVCNYSLKENTASVYWTAYKHTAKVGVKGQMDSVIVNGTETATSAMDALANATVEIYTSSINSKDEVRDQKLREIYFGSMSNTETIVGSLISWEGSETAGSCLFSLILNDNNQDVTGAYIVEDATVQVRFTMEPNQWGTEDAIAKLGEACAEKHTGEDGKTVFWPDVDILIEVALDKDCPDPS